MESRRAFSVAQTSLRAIYPSLDRTFLCICHEEGLVAGKQALLSNPSNGAIRHVRHEVVAFFGRLRRVDDFRAFVNPRRRIPL